MSLSESDLLSRYKWFAEQSCRINEALAALKNDVERAYSGDPSRLEHLFLFNDLHLFLMQVIAFDWFITRCMHAVRLEHKTRCGLVNRVDLLASESLRRKANYEALRSALEKIVRVRNAWAHRLCDEEIADDLDDLKDRLGLHKHDGFQWVTLEHVSADGCKVWTFVVSTLQQMAELIWRCVKDQMSKTAQGEA